MPCVSIAMSPEPAGMRPPKVGASRAPDPASDWLTIRCRRRRGTAKRPPLPSAQPSLRFLVVLVADPDGHFSAGPQHREESTRSAAADAGGSIWSLRFKPAHGHDDQAEVAHPVQQAVQGGLVRHRAGDDRLAVVAGDLEAFEPGRPALIEDSLDADLVARRRHPAAHARTLSDRRFRLAPAGERSRVSSAICSVLPSGSVI